MLLRPRLADHVARTIKKGAHALVEGSLVSSTYEQPNGKGKKSKTTKITSWSIRADVVRRLDRNEQEPEAPGEAPFSFLPFASPLCALSIVRRFRLLAAKLA